MFRRLFLSFLALFFFCYHEKSGLNVLQTVHASGDDHDEEGHNAYAFVTVYNISCFQSPDIASVKNYTFTLVPEDHEDEEDHDDHAHEDENTVLMATKMVHPFSEEDEDHDHDHEEHSEEEEIEEHYQTEVGEFEEDIEEAFEVAESAMTVVEAGEYIGRLDNTSTYEIHIEDNASVNLTFRCISPSSADSQFFQTYAFYFNEHIEAKLYEDNNAIPLSPLYSYETPDEEGLSKLQVWGYSILATLISTLASILALFLLFCVGEKVMKEIALYGGAFGAGAILMFVFSHIYPEAQELLALGGLSESELQWKCGTVFLAAFLVGILIHFFSDHNHNADSIQVHTEENKAGIELKSTESNAIVVSDHSESTSALDSEEVQAPVVESKGCCLNINVKRIKAAAWTVLLGDAFHNFFDGIMIALAFQYCSMSKGWMVMGAVMAHECPQEIADFLILLNSGMNIYQAAFCNFLSAVSAFLGVIVMLSIENISNQGLGYLLTINAGIFTFVGAEMAMNFLNYKGGVHAKVGLVLSFIFGTIVVGLTALAPHLHCDANGDHAHHDH